MNLAKLSSNKLLAGLLLFFIILSCSKEEKKPDEIVRVNNAVLTEDDVKTALESYSYQNKYREQYINDWIEKEVLFQKAVHEGIVERKEFSEIIEITRKELAAALLINDIIKENQVNPSLEELKSYYEAQKQDFRLTDNSVRLNIINFSDFDKAVQFRNILIESDWDKAANVFRGETTILSNEKEVVIYNHKLQPSILHRVVNNLLPGEISVVLETEPSKFTVVQVVDRLNKDDIPPFEVVQNLVRERYIIIKNKEIVRNYINQLIDDYDIEIKRYTE